MPPWQVHGKAVMRILTATGRGFNSPSGDADHDAFITKQCGTSQKGSTARYRKAALAALAGAPRDPNLDQE